MNQSHYALEVGQLTKTDAVKQYGIGEDIQPTIFGWEGEKLIMVATLAPRVTKAKRYEAFYMATVAMRRGFNAGRLFCHPRDRRCSRGSLCSR